MNESLQPEAALFGDLIFVSHNSFVSNINKRWQARYTKPKSRYNKSMPSHVAICVKGSDTAILDSVPIDGVKYGSIVKFYNNPKTTITVYRNIDLENKLKIGSLKQSDLIFKINSLWGERYNMYGAIFRKKIVGSKFCSEAVAAFFEGITNPIANVDQSQCYPLTLYNSCQDKSKWRKIQLESQQFLDAGTIKNSFNQISILKKRRLAIKKQSILSDGDKIILEGLNEQIEALEKLKAFNINMATNLSNPISSLDSITNHVNWFNKEMEKLFRKLRK